MSARVHMMRLDKYIADTSGFTRSQAAKAIRSGSVLVNGLAVRKPEQKVNELTDKYHKRYITVSGLRGFTLEENPLFVNPTLGDYRIREGVDFPDIEFEKIGRY